MSKLSEIPFKDLKVGDVLIGHNGVKGKISKLIDIAETSRREDNEVGIDWDDGNASLLWHFWGDCVEYVGTVTDPPIEPMRLIAELNWMGNVVTLLASETNPVEEAFQVRYESKGACRPFPKKTCCKSLTEARDLFDKYSHELKFHTSSSDMHWYMQQHAQPYVEKET